MELNFNVSLNLGKEVSYPEDNSLKSNLLKSLDKIDSFKEILKESGLVNEDKKVLDSPIGLKVLNALSNNDKEITIKDFKDIVSDLGDNDSIIDVHNETSNHEIEIFKDDLKIVDDSLLVDKDLKDLAEYVKNKKKSLVEKTNQTQQEYKNNLQLQKNTQREMNRLNISFSFVSSGLLEHENKINKSSINNNIESLKNPTEIKVQSTSGNVINENKSNSSNIYSNSVNKQKDHSPNKAEDENKLQLSSSLVVIGNKINTKITKLIENSSASIGIDIYQNPESKSNLSTYISNIEPTDTFVNYKISNNKNTINASSISNSLSDKEISKLSLDIHSLNNFSKNADNKQPVKAPINSKGKNITNIISSDKLVVNSENIVTTNFDIDNVELSKDHNIDDELNTKPDISSDKNIDNKVQNNQNTNLTNSEDIISNDPSVSDNVQGKLINESEVKTQTISDNNQTKPDPVEIPKLENLESNGSYSSLEGNILNKFNNDTKSQSEATKTQNQLDKTSVSSSNENAITSKSVDSSLNENPDNVSTVDNNKISYKINSSEVVSSDTVLNDNNEFISENPIDKKIDSNNNNVDNKSDSKPQLNNTEIIQGQNSKFEIKPPVSEDKQGNQNNKISLNNENNPAVTNTTDTSISHIVQLLDQVIIKSKVEIINNQTIKGLVSELGTTQEPVDQYSETKPFKNTTNLNQNQFNSKFSQNAQIKSDSLEISDKLELNISNSSIENSVIDKSNNDNKSEYEIANNQNQSDKNTTSLNPISSFSNEYHEIKTNNNFTSTSNSQHNEAINTKFIFHDNSSFVIENINNELDKEQQEDKLDRKDISSQSEQLSDKPFISIENKTESIQQSHTSNVTSENINKSDIKSNTSSDKNNSVTTSQDLLSDVDIKRPFNKNTLDKDDKKDFPSNKDVNLKDDISKLSRSTILKTNILHKNFSNNIIPNKVLDSLFEEKQAEKDNKTISKEYKRDNKISNELITSSSLNSLDNIPNENKSDIKAQFHNTEIVQEQHLSSQPELPANKDKQENQANNISSNNQSVEIKINKLNVSNTIYNSNSDITNLLHDVETGTIDVHVQPIKDLVAEPTIIQVPVIQGSNNKESKNTNSLNPNESNLKLTNTQDYVQSDIQNKSNNEIVNNQVKTDVNFVADRSENINSQTNELNIEISDDQNTNITNSEDIRSNDPAVYENVQDKLINESEVKTQTISENNKTKPDSVELPKLKNLEANGSYSSLENNIINKSNNDTKPQSEVTKTQNKLDKNSISSSDKNNITSQAVDILSNQNHENNGNVSTANNVQNNNTIDLEINVVDNKITSENPVDKEINSNNNNIDNKPDSKHQTNNTEIIQNLNNSSELELPINQNKQENQTNNFVSNNQSVEIKINKPTFDNTIDNNTSDNANLLHDIETNNKTETIDNHNQPIKDLVNEPPIVQAPVIQSSNNKESKNTVSISPNDSNNQTKLNPVELPNNLESNNNNNNNIDDTKPENGITGDQNQLNKNLVDVYNKNINTSEVVDSLSNEHYETNRNNNIPEKIEGTLNSKINKFVVNNHEISKNIQTESTTNTSGNLKTNDNVTDKSSNDNKSEITGIQSQLDKNLISDSNRNIITSDSINVLSMENPENNISNSVTTNNLSEINNDEFTAENPVHKEINSNSTQFNDTKIVQEQHLNSQLALPVNKDKQENQTNNFGSNNQNSESKINNLTVDNNINNGNSDITNLLHDVETGTIDVHVQPIKDLVAEPTIIQAPVLQSSNNKESKNTNSLNPNESNLKLTNTQDYVQPDIQNKYNNEIVNNQDNTNSPEVVTTQTNNLDVEVSDNQNNTTDISSNKNIDYKVQNKQNTNLTNSEDIRSNDSSVFENVQDKSINEFEVKTQTISENNQTKSDSVELPKLDNLEANDSYSSLESNIINKSNNDTKSQSEITKTQNQLDKDSVSSSNGNISTSKTFNSLSNQNSDNISTVDNNKISYNINSNEVVSSDTVLSNINEFISESPVLKEINSNNTQNNIDNKSDSKPQLNNTKIVQGQTSKPEVQLPVNEDKQENQHNNFVSNNENFEVKLNKPTVTNTNDTSTSDIVQLLDHVILNNKTETIDNHNQPIKGLVTEPTITQAHVSQHSENKESKNTIIINPNESNILSKDNIKTSQTINIKDTSSELNTKNNINNSLENKLFSPVLFNVYSDVKTTKITKSIGDTISLNKGADNLEHVFSPIIYKEGFSEINKLRIKEKQPSKNNNDVKTKTNNQTKYVPETYEDISKRLLGKLENIIGHDLDNKTSNIKTESKQPDNSDKSTKIKEQSINNETGYLAITSSNVFKASNTDAKSNVVKENKNEISDKKFSTNSNIKPKNVYKSNHEKTKLFESDIKDYMVKTPEANLFVGQVTCLSDKSKVKNVNLGSENRDLKKQITNTLSNGNNQIISNNFSELKSSTSYNSEKDISENTRTIYNSIENSNFVGYEIFEYIAKGNKKNSINSGSIDNIKPERTEYLGNDTDESYYDTETENNIKSENYILEENNNDFAVIDTNYLTANINSEIKDIFLPVLMKESKVKNNVQENVENQFINRNTEAETNVDNSSNRKSFELFNKSIKSEFPEIEIIHMTYDQVYKPEDVDITNKENYITLNNDKTMNKNVKETKDIQTKESENSNIEENNQLANTNTATIIQAINDGVPIHFSQVTKVVKESIGMVKNNKPLVISLNLNPFNMGELNLTFKLTDNNKMSIIFEASTLAAHKAMETYFNNIKSIVKENSLVLQELTSIYSPGGIKQTNQKDRPNNSNEFSSSDDSETNDNQQVRRKKKKGKYDDKEELKVDI